MMFAKQSPSDLCSENLTDANMQAQENFQSKTVDTI